MHLKRHFTKMCLKEKFNATFISKTSNCRFPFYVRRTFCVIETSLCKLSISALQSESKIDVKSFQRYLSWSSTVYKIMQNLSFSLRKPYLGIHLRLAEDMAVVVMAILFSQFIHPQSWLCILIKK